LSGVWDQILDPSPPPAAPARGPDHGGHLLERLGREGRPHLVIAGLVPANAGDGPDLEEESWAVRVHGELALIEPLDASVAPGDDREAFGVLCHAETEWSREGTEVLKSGWYGLGHRPPYLTRDCFAGQQTGFGRLAGGRRFWGCRLEESGEGARGFYGAEHNRPVLGCNFGTFIVGHSYSRTDSRAGCLPQEYSSLCSRVQFLTGEWRSSPHFHHHFTTSEMGLGVPRDYAEALRWYRKSAEQGEANGQKNLGYMPPP
jgi:hypothetical protein